MNSRAVAFACLFVVIGAGHADGPKDNIPDKVRTVPPPGVPLPDGERQELQSDIAALGKKIDELRGRLKGKPALLELLPDVEIFHKAVQWAVDYNEFFNKNEFKTAHLLLKDGLERAQQLEQGKAPWDTATGLIVRGYRSRIDGSVQPYGLVVPKTFQPGNARKHRLDFWFHGRGETLSELSFIRGRQSSPGQFAPPDTFVLHPYGRYCNANKLAGEVDTLEALEHARRHYPIDEDRLVVRGFSMGGAACWQFAVHYAGLWAAAAPGAGFSETADFLKVFQKESLQPSWYEQKLWHMYDCTDYAINLYNCPVVAYSGEKDSQKQAADMMAKALKAEGIDLVHLIGPGMGHSYHRDAIVEINRRIDALAAKGRQRVPARVKFTTWTLRYPEQLWVRIEGMGKHWERARVDAEITGPASVQVKTANVTALTLTMPPGWCPLDTTHHPKVILDGQEVEAAAVGSDRSWAAHFRKEGDKWQSGAMLESGLSKRPGLQGPIDDAFLERFLMVKPTGRSENTKVSTWAAAELEHAVKHWRQQYRGIAPVKNDDAVTDADIASSNLILWGDPASNRVLARIADRLPIRWTAQAVQVGDKTYAAADHVPVLIFPNPLNPKRYVVLNSGFTFREYDYLNNARQVPKLPDYAILDVNTLASSRFPGKIVAAGFFDERWQLGKKASGEK